MLHLYFNAAPITDQYTHGNIYKKITYIQFELKAVICPIVSFKVTYGYFKVTG